MALKTKIGPIIAVVISVLCIVWMVIGGNGVTVSPDVEVTQKSPTLQVSIEETALAYSVQAKTLSPQIIEVHLPLSGQTLANDTLQLTNNYPGRIIKLPADKGEFLKKGQSILQIDTRTLKNQIAEASLLVKQRSLELDSVKKLSEQNYSSKVNLAQAETALASAKAVKESLEINLENANLTAPFAGILNTLHVQEGQVLSTGNNIGTLVSINPIKISVNVPQNKIHQVALGTPGSIRLESGYQAEGAVTYISTTANTSSRSLTVEMEMKNPNNLISAGLTAAVDFLLNEQKAHAFSPALLTLDDDGRTAVKIININNEVVIQAVEVIKSERDKVWVIGLDDNVNIITVGQGFVSAGDVVQAHYED